MSSATNSEKPGRQPLSPAQRQRLQNWFQTGSRSSAKGDFDYATAMFEQCVKGDPGNALYVQNFLSNLHKKYNNNKSGVTLASVRGAGHKTSVKKASLQKAWEQVVQSGLEMLKLNPWDSQVLTDLAHACEQMGHDESQLVYLKGALDANLKDVELNRLTGRALARQGQFDAAIGCWTRVRATRPADEEAARAIANLTAERTIHKGGYEDAETSTEVMADRAAQAERQGLAPSSKLSPEQALEKAIAKDPRDISKYLELSEMHVNNEKFDAAEKVLDRAMAASGGDIGVRERLEDVQVRKARQQLHIAERRAQVEKSAESHELMQRLKTELNNKELEIYRNRCDRYPNSLAYKYELALRLQRAKNYSEAIKVYQEARGDTKRRGAVLYGLAVCFESIKQYKLAMQNYEAAILEIPEREVDQLKACLHRTGILAMTLKDWEKADKYLSQLAGVDFGYKDVAERLDKLAQLRDDKPLDDAPEA